MRTLRNLCLASVLAFSAQAVVNSAYAGDDATDCTGLEGKDLTKCEKAKAKEEKKKAKAAKDAGNAILPSQLDPSLASLDANNPFATVDYAVGLKTSGIAQVDTIVEKAAKLKATVVLGKYMIDQAKAGKTEGLKEMGAVVVKNLKELPDTVKSVQADIQKLQADIKSIATGADAMKLPKAIACLAGALTNVTDAGGEVTDVLKGLSEVVGG